MGHGAEADERPLISVARAAELAGLSKSVAYRLAAAGALPGLVRLPGMRLLVRRRVLEDWLAGAPAPAVGVALRPVDTLDQGRLGGQTRRPPSQHAGGRDDIGDHDGPRRASGAASRAR